MQYLENEHATPGRDNYESSNDTQSEESESEETRSMDFKVQIVQNDAV